MCEILADIQVLDDIDDELLDKVKVIWTQTLGGVEHEHDICQGPVTLSYKRNTTG